MEVFLCICKYLREIIYTNTNFLYTIFEQKNKEGGSHGFLPAAYLQSTLKTEGWRKPAYEKVEKGSIRISCPASSGRMPHIWGGTSLCGGNLAQAEYGLLLAQYAAHRIFRCFQFTVFLSNGSGRGDEYLEQGAVSKRRKNGNL